MQDFWFEKRWVGIFQILQGSDREGMCNSKVRWISHPVKDYLYCATVGKHFCFYWEPSKASDQAKKAHLLREISACVSLRLRGTRRGRQWIEKTRNFWVIFNLGNTVLWLQKSHYFKIKNPPIFIYLLLHTPKFDMRCEDANISKGKMPGISIAYNPLK